MRLFLMENPGDRNAPGVASGRATTAILEKGEVSDGAYSVEWF